MAGPFFLANSEKRVYWTLVQYESFLAQRGLRTKLPRGKLTGYQNTAPEAHTRHSSLLYKRQQRKQKF